MNIDGHGLSVAHKPTAPVCDHREQPLQLGDEREPLGEPKPRTGLYGGNALQGQPITGSPSRSSRWLGARHLPFGLAALARLALEVLGHGDCLLAAQPSLMAISQAAPGDLVRRGEGRE